MPAAEARALHDGLAARWNAILPEVAAVETIVVQDEPAVTCQLIDPPDARPGCILFLHGGGWSFGNLATYQRFMRLLARASHLRVLAVNYRLAPEHPFPAPFRDCRAAWRWLVGQSTADPRLRGPLSIAGDSAGANLAMAVMLDAVAKDQPLPAYALLFYGAFRAGVETPSYVRFAEQFGLTRAAMVRFWDYYVPDPTDRKNPLVSAVAAPDSTLALLPPLYLNAAGLDPLLWDTVDLVARLRHAGAAPTVVLNEGVHHGFMQMSLKLPEAQRAIESAAHFARAQYG